MNESQSANVHAGPFLRYGNFIFRRRNLIFPAAMIVMLLFYRPEFAFQDPIWDIYLDIIGLLVGLVGVILRAAVVGIEYIKRGGRNKRIAADHLVTGGLFAHCRNPLYVGNLLIVAGILLIANNPWLYLFGGWFFVISYSAMVAAEEQFLSIKFGQAYADYCRRVPRWGIRLQGLRDMLRLGRIDWNRIIVKEYSSFGVWVLMNFAVFGYEEFVNEPIAHSAYEVAIAALGVVAALLLIVVVRAFKKSGWFNHGSV